MSQPLLGDGSSPMSDNEYISALQSKVRELERRLVDQETLLRERDTAVAAVRALEHQLSPLYQSLQRLFGDISEVLPPSSGSAQTMPGSAKWDSWKKSLPGRPAEFIDLLLVHGEMTTAQLMAAAKCAKQTVYDTAFKMSKAGILTNAGGKYRLKNL